MSRPQLETERHQNLDKESKKYFENLVYQNKNIQMEI
jgi:hypothetical protein